MKKRLPIQKKKDVLTYQENYDSVFYDDKSVKESENITKLKSFSIFHGSLENLKASKT